MKKFMVLYMASGAEFEKMMKNSTPEQREQLVIIGVLKKSLQT
jgi:hypothetical protein